MIRLPLPAVHELLVTYRPGRNDAAEKMQNSMAGTSDGLISSDALVVTMHI